MNSKNSGNTIKRSLCVVYCIIAIQSITSVKADDYHYKNLLIGERAAGLGGTYTAISDDPTGLYYNPAGMVYGFENYISVSANTVNIQETRYVNVISGHDYTLSSRNLVPNFFGFTQSYGKNKFAFAIIVPNSELINQDDELDDLSSVAAGLRKRYFRQNTTYLIGPGYSMALGDSASIGLSLLGNFRFDTQIDNQLLQYTPAGTGEYLIQNTSIKRELYGILPKLGIQFMPTPKVAIGLTVSKNFVLTGNGSSTTVVPITGNSTNHQNGSFSHDYTINQVQLAAKDPSPLIVEAGSAFFPSKTLLLSADFSYYTADKDFGLASTYNISIGSELFLADSFAIRVGLFTNNANTPAFIANKTDQLPHVDMLGGSLGLSFLKPGSSFTLGSYYSSGSGQGQVVSGVTNVQVVQMSNLNIFLSGSYQL